MRTSLVNNSSACHCEGAKRLRQSRGIASLKLAMTQGLLRLMARNDRGKCIIHQAPIIRGF